MVAWLAALLPIRPHMKRTPVMPGDAMDARTRRPQVDAGRTMTEARKVPSIEADTASALAVEDVPPRSAHGLFTAAHQALSHV